MRIEFWSNWDIEGSFQIISWSSEATTEQLRLRIRIRAYRATAHDSGHVLHGRIPGLATHLLQHPKRCSGHANASNVLFMFGHHNHQTGYGGFASSSWEGVAIDESRSSTVRDGQESGYNFPIFHPTPADKSATHVVGWMRLRPTNEWNWTTRWHESLESLLESFEASMTATWMGHQGTWPDGWEIGQE